MKNISTANKGLQALAKKSPALVENRFGYDVPGYMVGGTVGSPAPTGGGSGGLGDFMKILGSLFGGQGNADEQRQQAKVTSTPFDMPEVKSGIDLDFSDVFDKDAQDEAKEDLDNFELGRMKALSPDEIDFDELEETLDDGVAIDISGKTSEEIGQEIAGRKTPTDYLNLIADLGSAFGTQPGDAPQVQQARILASPRFEAPSIGRFAGGGIASMMPMEMREGGMTFNPFLDGMENRFGEFDPRDYLKNVLGIDGIDSDYGLTEEEIAEKEAKRAAATLARAYGAPSAGITSLSMGYGDVKPGQSVMIDPTAKEQAAYRFYPSEVSKIYAQAKGVPFSPLVAPPKEATYVEALQPRRIASQLYAKDGTFVERDQLVTGPGGERGDQIPAMLSDGEFVTNSAAVRGMGIAAGADPDDEYEQRLMGAREMYKMQKFGEEIAKMLR